MENKMNEMMNEMMNNMMAMMMQQAMQNMMQSMMAQFGGNTNQLSAPQKSEEAEEKKDNHVNAAIACTTADVKCNWAVEEILDGKKKFYRIVDGIFTAGKWRQSKYDANKEYRIPTNLEAHKIALSKIKALPLIQSIKPNGSDWFAYGFTSKKAAEEALKHLPSKIDRAEIASYIQEYGPIKGKAVTREKKTA